MNRARARGSRSCSRAPPVTAACGRFRGDTDRARPRPMRADRDAGRAVDARRSSSAQGRRRRCRGPTGAPRRTPRRQSGADDAGSRPLAGRHEPEDARACAGCPGRASAHLFDVLDGDHRISHAAGGYLLGMAASHHYVFDAGVHEDVYWAPGEPASIEWHSYGIYGPFCNRATSLLYELGAAPADDRRWVLCRRHSVTTLCLLDEMVTQHLRPGCSRHATAISEVSEYSGRSGVGSPPTPDAGTTRPSGTDAARWSTRGCCPRPRWPS
jgi:hypothetical protein